MLVLLVIWVNKDFGFGFFGFSNDSSYPRPFLCFLVLNSVVEEHAEKQAENQSITLEQITETSADPTASPVPSELDLTELGQTDSIPPPPKESKQVHTHKYTTSTFVRLI